jgi:hypothetical protein
MKNRKFKSAVMMMLCMSLVSNMVASEAKAALGVISLIGGPAGVGLIEAGAVVFGAGYVYSGVMEGAAKLAPHKINEDYALFGAFPMFAGLFLMDQQVGSVPAMTKQDLRDNGYTDAQIARIQADGAKLNAKLKKEKKAISMSTHETLASIREGLKKIAPDASEEFLDVASQRMYLVAQAHQNDKDARMSETNSKEIAKSQSNASSAEPQRGEPSASAAN